MENILLSWYATVHDFLHSGDGNARRRLIQVNENGPTVSVHQYHWDDYSRHVLLYNPNRQGNIDELDYAEALSSFLRKHFPEHGIELRKLSIDDPIDLEEICHKTLELLAELTLRHEVDIFISPGTPAMQMAWIMNGLNFKDKVTLFQGREARHSKSGRHEKVYVNLDSSIFPRNMSVAQAITNADEPETAYPPGMEDIYNKAIQVARTHQITCLITGPNGSGKERLARFVHDQSARRDKPYKAVNCAAYSDELLASELFGHRKGSFTGAYEHKTGLLESAEGGTVFLDEIGDISPKMQVSLLRVLQEKEIQPIGSNEPRKIDVRIIAATNRNLKQEAEAGRFRWDLYYRLHIATLELQPLVAQGSRVIKEWIRIKNHQYAPEFGNHPLKFAPEALEAMVRYHWPGNIRELEHTIIRLYTFREDAERSIEKRELPDDILSPESSNLRLEDAERLQIERVWRLTNGNISRCSELLACSRNTLKAKLAIYKLSNRTDND